MKYGEIEGMDLKELTKKLKDLRHESFELSMKNTMGQQVTNPMMIRILRRDKARVMTALNKKQTSGSKK
jgi:ribosomal protein L29